MGTNVGLDIGYSNTKLVYSGGDEGHQESVFPVGVSRLDQFNRQIKGITGGDVDTTIVMVDGVEYAAGIAPGKVLMVTGILGWLMRLYGFPSGRYGGRSISR